MLEFDTIKARALTPEEIRALTTEDTVYIAESDFTRTVLAAGKITGKGPRHIKEESVEIRTIYGVSCWYAFGEVYTADGKGGEMLALRTAGTRMSSTLFFPGLDAEEAKERLYAAIRSEFGSGFVEEWSLRTGPVRALRWNVYAVKRERVTVAQPDRRKKSTQSRVVETSRRLLIQGAWDGHDNHLRNQLELGEELHMELYIDPENQKGRI